MESECESLESERDSGLAGYPGSESVSVPPATVATVQENAVTLHASPRPHLFLSSSCDLLSPFWRTTITDTIHDDDGHEDDSLGTE